MEWSNITNIVNSIKALDDEGFEEFLALIKEKDNLSDEKFEQVKMDLTSIYR